MLELGASFRKSRESQNLSIERIAGETRISSRFLEAIENEQFELLPGGIFNRGFIRTYAVRLGLDPDEAVQGYEKLVRTSEAEPAYQETERPRGKTTKIPVYYVALAGLLILVVVFYFLTRPTEAPKITPDAPIKEASDKAPEPPPETPLPETPAPEAPSVSAAAPVPTPAPSATPATPVAPIVKVAQTARISPQGPPPSNAAANAAVVVELEVQEETWFKLASDGSEVVPSELLAAGTVRRYTAANSINVSIGNAAGVSLRVNGQPVGSLGRNGQVRNLTITPNTSAASLNVR